MSSVSSWCVQTLAPWPSGCLGFRGLVGRLMVAWAAAVLVLVLVPAILLAPAADRSPQRFTGN